MDGDIIVMQKDEDQIEKLLEKDKKTVKRTTIILDKEEREFVDSLVKEGKEPGQGVAYLDDGTMVVIENGRRHMSRSLDVVVTSVLQTTAGRMIFGKVKEETTGQFGESVQHRQEWQRG